MNARDALAGQLHEAAARRRRRRFSAPAFALGAACAAAVAAVLVVGSGADPSDEREIAAGTQRANVAGSPQADAVLASGKAFYQRNRFHVSTSYFDADARPTPRPAEAAFAVARDVPEHVWIAPDGSARIEYGSESPAYLPTDADRRAWLAAGSPDLERLLGPSGGWGPKRENYPRGSFLREWLLNSNLERVLPAEDPLSVLPREPTALAAFLTTAAGKQRPDGGEAARREAFVSDLLTFLRYPLTPPDLRAALVEVAKSAADDRSPRELTDAAGRPALGLDFAYDEHNNAVLAIDPRTNALLAQGMRARGGYDWGYTYGLATAGVTRLGDRP